MINYLELLRWHNTNKCGYPKCKHTFDDPVVITHIKRRQIVGWKPNAKFLFHYYDTHGFPPEITIEMLDKLINSEMTSDEITVYNHLIKQDIAQPH